MQLSQSPTRRRQQASNTRESGTTPIHQLKSQVDKQKRGKRKDFRRDSHRNTQPERWHPPGYHPFRCWNCGASRRHAKEAYPAFEKEYHACHQSGHFQSVCTKGNGPTAKHGSPTTKPETVGSISVHSNQSNDMVQLTITPVGGTDAEIVSTLPDSGASIDGIPAGLCWNQFKNFPISHGTTKSVTATEVAGCHWDISTRPYNGDPALVGRFRPYLFMFCKIFNSQYSQKTHKRNLACCLRIIHTRIFWPPFIRFWSHLFHRKSGHLSYQI